MSPFFDDLEAQLAAAARAQTVDRDAARRRVSSRGRTWFAAAGRALPVVLAVGCAVAVAVAVVAVVLVHHRHHAEVRRPAVSPISNTGPVTLLPTDPTPAQREELTVIYAAQRTVDRQHILTCLTRSSALLAGRPGARPSLSDGSPTSGTLAALGVLRRPAVASDTLPPRILGPPNRRVFPDGTYPPVKDIYLRYIRKARHRYGANYYLVPAANINLIEPTLASCSHWQQRALASRLAHVSARFRAQTDRLERRYLAQLHHDALPYSGVCLLALNGTGNGDGDCGAGGTLTQIEHGQALAGGAPTGAEVYYGLAPDGVRSITFTFHSKYVHHPVTALVINNVFIVRNDKGRLGSIATETWRAANGRIIAIVRHS